MRLVSLIMLPVWGVLALLGHSGTHVLADWLGVCCHVETGVADVDSRDSADEEHFCTHCARMHGAAAQPKDGPPAAPPAHDSKNCRLCEWLLSWQPQVPPSTPTLPEQSWELLQRVVDVRQVQCQAVPAVSRGPPVA
jgi:hypothetical protein